MKSFIRNIFFRQKKAILTETLMFILIVLAFVFLSIFFIIRLGSGATLYEQIYAKQFALILDGAKPGTNITLFVPIFFNIAEKNKIKFTDTIKITAENEIVVTLIKGSEYKFKCFSALNSNMIELNQRESTVKFIV
jgi:hypothetical protein